MKRRPRPHGDHEYDFHGLRAADAERRLRAILDRHGGERGCVVAIVHGKGSGVLADMVARVAGSHPKVSHVQRGFVNSGVTRIEIAG